MSRNAASVASRGLGFALPRGGVPVAAPVAASLRVPLDLVLVRKLGVPFRPELGMGAIADGGRRVIVRNDDVIAMARVSKDEFEAACRGQLAEIERRRIATSADDRGPQREGAWP